MCGCVTLAMNTVPVIVPVYVCVSVAVCVGERGIMSVRVCVLWMT